MSASAAIKVSFEWEEDDGVPRHAGSGLTFNEEDGRPHPLAHVYGVLTLQLLIEDQIFWIYPNTAGDTLDFTILMLLSTLLQCLTDRDPATLEKHQTESDLSLQVVDGKVLLSTAWYSVGPDQSEPQPIQSRARTFSVVLKDFHREVLAAAWRFHDEAVVAFGAEGTNLMSGFRQSLREIEDKIASTL
jgi:hypothetical protein